MKLKVTGIGTSLGVVLPKEALARLKVDKGDSLYLTEAPDGYRVSPYDPEFERIMTSAKKMSRRYRNALRELAK